jgi:hypothetical protein
VRRILLLTGTPLPPPRIVPVLFDTGQTTALAHNAATLGIPLGSANARALGEGVVSGAADASYLFLA